MSVAIDDSDPIVVYSSGWEKAGNPGEYDQTTSAANQVGMTAKLNFQGIRVTVYGTIGPPFGGGAPKSSYVVDGGDPVIFSASQINDVQYTQQFYQSPILSDGSHTLTVTNLLKSDRLYLDYFLVVLAGAKSTTPLSLPQVTTTSSSRTYTTNTINGPKTGSTNGPNAAVIGNVTATASITVTVASTTYPLHGTPSTNETLIGSIPVNSPSSSAESSRTAVIIASTIAAVLGITLFLCAIYAWRRRRNRLGDEQIISSFHELPRSSGREKAYRAGSQFTFQESSSTTHILDTTTHPYPSASSLATAGQQSILIPRLSHVRYITPQPDDPVDISLPVYPPNDPPSYDQEVIQGPSNPGHPLPSKLRSEYNF